LTFTKIFPLTSRHPTHTHTHTHARARARIEQEQNKSNKIRLAN